jgi:hypothetical protein
MVADYNDCENIEVNNKLINELIDIQQCGLAVSLIHLNREIAIVIG